MSTFALRHIVLAVTASIVVGLGAGSFAFAADMPVKGPVYKTPVTDADWTGLYVGAALGAKWSHTTWTTSPILYSGAPFAADASSPRDYDASSVRAGGYLGYNYQFAPKWVGGIEFDFAYANKTVTTAGIPGCTILCIPGTPGPGADQSSVKMRWDASARARLGYVVLPNTLVYATGGIAWQNMETSATCQHSTPDPICVNVAGNPFVTTTNSVTRTGWTLGAGVDAKLYGNWILRGEYRYANFGTWNEGFNLSFATGATTVVNAQMKVSTQIATLGLAYKFGSPVAAK